MLRRVTCALVAICLTGCATFEETRRVEDHFLRKAESSTVLDGEQIGATVTASRVEPGATIPVVVQVTQHRTCRHSTADVVDRDVFVTRHMTRSSESMLVLGSVVVGLASLLPILLPLQVAPDGDPGQVRAVGAGVLGFTVGYNVVERLRTHKTSHLRLGEVTGPATIDD